MALIDVKEYYLKILNQYIEIKDDLKDFEQALKDGHITEDQLQQAKDDITRVKENVDRLSYILYLFELPKRKSKKAIFANNQSNKLLFEYFKNNNADKDSVEAETLDTLTHLRVELKKIKEESR